MIRASVTRRRRKRQGNESMTKSHSDEELGPTEPPEDPGGRPVSDIGGYEGSFRLASTPEELTKIETIAARGPRLVVGAHR